jgi:hypothetical protein
MDTGRSTQTYCVTEALGNEGNEAMTRPRLGHIPESTAMRDIIDVAMVGLIGGGPRLAMRAARAFLQDSYAFRFSARPPRVPASDRRGE